MKGCSFRFFFIIISKFILPALCFIVFTGWADAQDSEILTGFRASRIPSSYPNNEFPNEDYWVTVGEGISQKFENSSPSSIWIVSLYQGGGETRMGFPSDGISRGNVLYSDKDLSEEYLSRFDQEGFKIYLQIEPGDADVDSLINLVLSKYGHHSCVAGFGVDVEWLNPEQNPDGRKVTDEEADRWEKLVKSFNPSYQFFLKHYFYEWMPPNYRGDILFIDDGQQFSSLGSMLIYFKEWANNFNGSKVGFQFGYPADEFWWSLLDDPARRIGEALINNIPNTAGLFWVDFSVTSLFPLTPTSAEDNSNEMDYYLSQNFPNPFNPSTKINFSISTPGIVLIKVYDMLGNELTTLLNEYKQAGNYQVNFNTSDLPGLSSGVYLYRITAGNFSATKQMILIK